MRAEISSLFYIIELPGPVVQDAHIGSGVYIKQLEAEWIDEVRTQCPKVEAREQLESQHYTHRLCIEASVEEDAMDYEHEVSKDEMQPILRAIALSRIVKPTAIAYDNVWIKSVYSDLGEVKHYSDPEINAYSVAYVSPTDTWNILTEEDASLMAQLWDSLLHFLDNEPKYRRIVRALKYYELAHAIYFTELSHPVFHAALESMICTSHRHNKDQVTQRLPRLVPFVTPQLAEDIYRTCCDFKHAAQALRQIQTASGALAPSDQRRLDATILLRQAVRELLLETLRNRAFADMAADPELLTQTYKVLDRKGRLVGRSWINGIVFDESDTNRISDAAVELIGDSDSPRLRSVKLTGLTDSNGKYSFIDVLYGDHTFRVSAPGFITYEIKLYVAPDALTELHVKLRKQK